MSIIEISNLRKNFGNVTALDGIDLKVEKGEVLGFIGPNGAGKTTTIRTLLGLLRKDSGECKLFGKDAWSDAVKLHSRLAYVPGDVSLWPNFTGGEVIDIFVKLRGGKIDNNRRQQMIKRFDLDPTKKCRTYSKGNRQKVALISAFASDVDLFIFDEPTSGLDPLMESIFQECLKEFKNEGKTILLSSHILAEVEKSCDKVSIIRQGKIVESGSLDELRHLTQTSIAVETSKKITGLEKVNGVNDIVVNNNKATFQVEGKELDKVLKFLTDFRVVAITCNPPTLEELFMRHYNLKENDQQ